MEPFEEAERVEEGGEPVPWGNRIPLARFRGQEAKVVVAEKDDVLVGEGIGLRE